MEDLTCGLLGAACTDAAGVGADMSGHEGKEIGETLGGEAAEAAGDEMLTVRMGEFTDRGAVALVAGIMGDTGELTGCS